MLDHAGRVVDMVVAETGKSQDAQIANLAITASALGFWAKQAQKYLADERVSHERSDGGGKKLVVRYVPLGIVGVIGPWSHPITNSFGDAILR